MKIIIEIEENEIKYLKELSKTLNIPIEKLISDITIYTNLKIREKLKLQYIKKIIES